MRLIERERERAALGDGGKVVTGRGTEMRGSNAHGWPAGGGQGFEWIRGGLENP